MKFLGIIIIPAELGLCPDLGRIICDKRDMMVQMSQNEKHCLKLYYQLFKCFHVTKTINYLLYPYDVRKNMKIYFYHRQVIY